MSRSGLRTEVSEVVGKASGRMGGGREEVGDVFFLGDVIFHQPGRGNDDAFLG